MVRERVREPIGDLLGYKRTGLGAKGLGTARFHRRHKKVLKDSIQRISNGSIRRLARRGGVIRISANVYDEVRRALKDRLEKIMAEVVAIVEYQARKTVTVQDIVFILNRLGSPLYGFHDSILSVRGTYRT